MKHKKLLIIFLCFTILLIASSCTKFTNTIETVKSESMTTFTNLRTELLDKISYSEDSICEEMLNNVLNAIDNKENETIKNKFLTSVHSDKLDKQIELFLSMYEGPFDAINDIGSDSVSSSYDGDEGESHIINDYFSLELNGEIYHGLMTMLVTGGYDIKNAKLLVFELATSEAYESKYFFFHSNQLGESGIFYQNSAELREELIMVSGRMFINLNVERELSKEDLLLVLTNNNSFEEFIKEMGYPDAIWENFNYYYYKLNTGLYAVFQVEKDKIKYIYIADEDDKIETLWIGNNYIELWGDYVEYTHVDRVLTIEQFLKYTDENQNLNDLNGKLGEPSAEESFYVYYELDDGRFLMCHASDVIKEVYLVDTKNIIEIIRDYDEDSSNIDKEYWEQK